MNVCQQILDSELSGAPPKEDSRKGSFLVLSLFCLIGCLAAAALSIDVGYIQVQQSRMQNAVDAAALAAAQEITNAVKNAPPDTTDPTAYALGQARTAANYVAGLSGIFVDANKDVVFGQRQYNPSTKTWSITWGASPANTVKVTARRSGDDASAKDGKLKLFFGSAIGTGYGKVTTQAVAYVEARDIAVVHDFSRSMNFDSHFPLYSEQTTRMSDAQVVANMQLLWNDLNLDVGNLEFDPEYLTLSNTSSGVATSVTFKYNKASIVTSGTLQSIKLNYASGSNTFSASGQSAEVTGSNDITSVVVTSQSSPNLTASTMTSSNVTVEFSADRKTATISTTSSKYLKTMRLSMQNGSDSTFTFPSYRRSYNYSSSNPIGSLKIDLSSSGTNWISFDPPDASTPQTVTQQFNDTNDNVLAAFGLDSEPYPYPSGSWNGFVSHCRNDEQIVARGYRETYGGLGFVNYILRNYSSHSQTPALCKARHYPFSAIKQGHEVLCNFLQTLSFDDRVGMVSYDSNHRIETTSLDPYDVTIPVVNVATNPLSSNYSDINTLMKYKQANYYSAATNMGGGLSDGIKLLDTYARAGTQPTILLMTDGNSNAWDSGSSSSLPSGFDWDSLFDYDGDGSKDYYTTDSQSRYVLGRAYEAIQKGYTIHTISVGADADTDLLKAIAFMGDGEYVCVPAASTPAEMESQLMAAFQKIASTVPPAKILNADK
jgi:Flp pilus assembly protein TadG